ncbi:MAG: hypothetical protein LC799_15220, partial [Actinobacteria bacterium]|nr:hypothetical protein [Actinomycetota bacterium]
MATVTPAPDTGSQSQPAPTTATNRNIELAMLAFAAVVVTTALVLVELNQANELTRSLLYYGAAYLSLFGVAHIAMRYLAPHADPLMLPCVALLNGLGLVLIHRLDLAQAAAAAAVGEPIPAGDVPRQIAWTALALGLF